MEARFTALVLLLSLLFVAASASAFIRRGEEEQQAIHMKAQQATKGQQAAAEMTGDDCTTWYEQTDHGSAFRNAKDFGAKGDGVTDDTVALQHALTDGRSPQFSTKTPLVVYLPPGTYLVSDTLDLYFYTHLIGNYKSVSSWCLFPLIPCPHVVLCSETKNGQSNHELGLLLCIVYVSFSSIAVLDTLVSFYGLSCLGCFLC
eukprot:m.193691 g.193691  ORF g.193691 m.193691 type:complete len:202 (-) comp16783_c2_seq11:2016-2621(-)